MGLRYRKSINVAPGVKLNLGKNGTGVSAGTKGAHVSLSNKGKVTTTTGIPGTGVSYSSSPRRKKRTGCLTQILAVPVLLVLFALVGSLFSKTNSKNKAALDPTIIENTQSTTSTPTRDTAPAKPDIESLQKIATSFLSEQFHMDVTEMIDRDLRYEITVTANGISDRENQAEEPVDWQNFQLDFISAQARVSDELSISNTSLRNLF